MNEIMTQTEAAAFLHCDEEVLEHRRVAGDIVYVDDDGQILFLREDLLDHMRSKRKIGDVKVTEVGQHSARLGRQDEYPDILTEPEAAKFLRLGSSTVRSMRRGDLIPHLPEKPARYLKSSLLDWEKSREVQPKPQEPRAAPRKRRTYHIDEGKAALAAIILD